MENNFTSRPQSLNEYIGQDLLKEKLKIYIGAALQRNESLDHVLLFGPPGLGKTTLARVIANELGSNLHFISGPTIEKPGDLATVLSELKPLDVLFIDEIHRLPKIVEESLYSAMEDFVFNVLINNEYVGKSISIHLPPFTLIGATTKPGLLSYALRTRFGISERINFYKEEEISDIIDKNTKKYNLSISKDASINIAKRSRGTPRIALKYFRRIRDFANYNNKKEIELNDVLKMFDLLNVDPIGLDQVDLNYIKTIIFRFNGGPVGIETISNCIGEEVINLEDVYEPYLLKIGFIEKTNKGRIVKKAAYEYLNIKKNKWK